MGGNLTLDGVEIKVIVPNGTNDYNYGIKAFASADADGDGTIDDPVKVTMNNSVITEVENSDAGENYGASGVIVIGKHKNDTVNDNLDNRDAALEINGSTITVSAFAVSGNGAAHGTKNRHKQFNAYIRESNCNLPSANRRDEYQRGNDNG